VIRESQRPDHEKIVTLAGSRLLIALSLFRERHGAHYITVRPFRSIALSRARRISMVFLVGGDCGRFSFCGNHPITRPRHTSPYLFHQKHLFNFVYGRPKQFRRTSPIGLSNPIPPHRRERSSRV